MKQKITFFARPARCGSRASAGLLTACNDKKVAATGDVGDCVQQSELTGSEIGHIDTVDCSTAHYAELIGKFDLPDGDFPGADAIGTQSEQGCEDRFQDYVGIDYASSKYYLSPVTPTEQTWNDADDREVLCYAYDPSSTITGSIQGAAV